MARVWSRLSQLLAVATALVAMAAMAVLVAASPVKQLSFESPFTQIDPRTGDRMVGDDFTYGGATEVKKNFIRLTTDRQSRRGHLWSKSTVNSDTMVLILQFRIHGQGKKWFGDGIGLWLTHEPRFKQGQNHGFTDKYHGVGIVLDTFKNVEHRGGHKDVTVQINRGDKTLAQLNDETKQGCDAAFRFHADSGDFDPVYSSSRVRLRVDGNKLTVSVDPRSEGAWTDCFEGDLPFSRQWLRQATIGLTASTGSLADNHDILKLTVYDDVEDHGATHADSLVWTHNYSKDFDKLLESDTCDQTCKITILQKYISNFQIETEHWFEELKETTANTVEKLKERERENSRKIQYLTTRMHDHVVKKVGQRLDSVKTQVATEVANKVDEEVVSASSGWRVPFFLLLIALAGALGVAYQKYQKLIKNHLL